MKNQKPPARKTHPPRYNTLNDIVGAWSLTLAYEDDADVIRLTAHTPGSRWTKSHRLNMTWAPDDVEEALSEVLILVRTWGATRLF